jgi:hypothetical protein
MHKWREQMATLRRSPLATAFPQTAIGQRLLQSQTWQQLQQIAAALFEELKTTPTELLEEVLGDAWAFAYTPAADADTPETSLLIIAPRRSELLQQLVQRINELQRRTGELDAVIQQRQGPYTLSVRQKKNGARECYAFHDGLFLFSNSPATLLAALEQADRPEPSLWEQRLQRWGLQDAICVVAVEPRRWDGLWQRRLAEAAGPERQLLQHWAQIWNTLEALALGVRLTDSVLVDLVVQTVAQQKATVWESLLRRTATSERTWLPPADAWLACQLQGELTDWLDGLDAFMPPADKGALARWLDNQLGPLVGRDQWPLVRQALGPSWALWLEPPLQDTELPACAVAVALQGPPEQRCTAARAVCQAFTFLFHAYRVHHNANAPDQIHWQEWPDAPPGLSGMLVNHKTFPPGFSPCFAIVADHLLVASSPHVLTRFRQRHQAGLLTKPPTLGPQTALWLNLRHCQQYLRRHQEPLARHLAVLTATEEKTLRQHLADWTEVLEPLDTIRLDLSQQPQTFRLTLHVRLRWTLLPQQ